MASKQNHIAPLLREATDNPSVLSAQQGVAPVDGPPGGVVDGYSRQ